MSKDECQVLFIILMFVVSLVAIPSYQTVQQRKVQSKEMSTNECKLTGLDEADIEGIKYTYACKGGFVRIIDFDISKYAER